jgi:hypothetical protein
VEAQVTFLNYSRSSRTVPRLTITVDAGPVGERASASVLTFRNIEVEALAQSAVPSAEAASMQPLQ